MCVLGLCAVPIHMPSRVTIYYAYFVLRVCSLAFLCVSKSIPLYFSLSLLSFSVSVPVTDFTESYVCVCVCARARVRVCARWTTLQAKLEREIDRLSKGHVYVEAGVNVVRPGTTF